MDYGNKHKSPDAGVPPTRKDAPITPDKHRYRLLGESGLVEDEDGNIYSASEIDDSDREDWMSSEEQAYFWRMLKLTGHPDVTIYEMQGYDHGAMPHLAYHILKEHIKRLTGRKKG